MSKPIHVLLFDGNSIYRRFHGAMSNQGSEDSVERSVQAMEATQKKVFDLSRSLKGTHGCVFFDGGEKTWRHEFHPTYKCDPKTGEPKIKPQAMIDSILMCQQNISSTGIKTHRDETKEADDGIAAIANILSNKPNIKVTIVANDKDMFQLVTNNVVCHMPFERIDVDEKWVVDKYGCSGGKLTELFTLMGDASDNIPGVKGVGAIKAKKLLDDYKDIETLIACAHIVPGAIGRNISDNIDLIPVCKKLINLRDIDYPLGFKMSDMRMPENFLAKKKPEYNGFGM